MKRIELSDSTKAKLQKLLNRHKRYDLFTRSLNSYEYAKILNELITYCAYCNITEIKAKYRDNGRAGDRMEFDHFLPQDGTRERDLNCNNLIPSCHNCNHYKSDDNSDIINPLEEDFDSVAQFRLDSNPQSIDDFRNANIILEPITNNPVIYQKVENYISLFNLINRYNAPTIKSKFDDLYRNLSFYPSIKRKEIDDLIPLEQDVLDRIMELKNNNINHTECGKFKKDIIQHYLQNN